MSTKPGTKASETARNAIMDPVEVLHTSRDGENSTPSIAGKFLLALMVAVSLNGLLLVFIGYFNRQDMDRGTSEKEWSVQRVQFARPARMSSPPENTETKKQETNSPNQQDVSRVTPQKQKDIDVRTSGLVSGLSANVSNLQLELEGIESDVSVSQNTSPATQSSDGTKTSEKQSLGSTGSEKQSFREGQLDELPERTGGPRPSYPWSARKKGVEGWVKLELTISKQGRVVSIDVLEWKGSQAFPEAATNAVRKWTYRPGKVDGQPVTTKGAVQTIEFQIDG